MALLARALNPYTQLSPQIWEDLHQNRARFSETILEKIARGGQRTIEKFKLITLSSTLYFNDA